MPVCTWADGRLTSVEAAAFILDHVDGDGYGLPRPATIEEAGTVAGRVGELSSIRVSTDHRGVLTLNLRRAGSEEPSLDGRPSSSATVSG